LEFAMPVIKGTIDAKLGPIVQVIVGADETYIKHLISNGRSVPQSKHLMAIIDSGAERSGLSNGLAKKLSLQENGTCEVTSLSVTTTQIKYLSSLSMLDFDCTVHKFSECFDVIDLPRTLNPISLLIGRDVLDKCVYVYNGPMKNWTLEF
jgi:hypothetical protein